MAEALAAIVEGVLTGVAAGAGLTWFYNRYLAGLRESYAKKAMSLMAIPVAAVGGFCHGVAVYIDIPHTSIFAWVGLVILLWTSVLAFGRWNRNRRTIRMSLGTVYGGINYARYPTPIRFALRLTKPFNGVDKVQVAKYDVELEGLHRDLEGLRILFLTDFHVHPTLTASYYRGIVEESLKLKPDVVLVGGDFVSRSWYAKAAAKCLEPLAEHPKVLAVRGNHDFWTRPAWFARMLEKMGIALLTNDIAVVEKGEGRLAIAGLEHPYIPLTARAASELKPRIASLGEDTSLLGLVHTPETFQAAHALGCQACVCGHTHGGQIRLPFFGTTIASSPLPERYVWGRATWKGMQTIVSNGIGAFFPVRFLCPPQVVMLVLRGGNGPT